MSKLSTRQILERLIAFPTVSRESNLELIEFVQDYLAGFGIESELFYNPERTKANVFATLGPNAGGGIVLSGHTDVVPVDGQPWTVEPFVLRQKDDRLYGRGTADMKGFIASVLGMLPVFLSKPLARPVHLAFSYDEEVGCLGVRSMLAELGKRSNKPALCLIGEPTSLQPVLGHKGKLAMRCKVHGAACHSAYAPQGVNAIEYAAKLICHLGDIARDLAHPALHDDRFDPPYSTIQTGLIKGGRALNIVPAECEFDFEVRALPGFDPQAVHARLESYAKNELLPRMQAVSAQTAITFERLAEYPGLATPPDSEAAQLLAAITGFSEFSTVAFGSEGGLFDQAGIPAVICGPGSMDQGHKPDEFVAIEQLEACDAMLLRLAHHLHQA